MAAIGGLLSIIGGLPTDTKRVMTELINAAFPQLRFGPLDSAKAENFAGYKITSTTAESTGEFSIEHGMARAPYIAHQVIDLSAVGARLGIPLTVTRAADGRRMYFKTESGSTNVVFSLYVE